MTDKKEPAGNPTASKKKVAKARTAKKAAAKTATPRAAAKKPAERKLISPLERLTMISEAAYYRAEKRGFFGGNPIEDWIEAEKQIDAEYKVDLSKILMMPNPGDMLEQLKQAFRTHQLPGVDVNAIVDSQRKNVEALTEANKLAVEGARGIIGKQTEILRETIEEVMSTLKEVSSSKNPKELPAKQAELVKHAFEKAFSNMREMSDMINMTNTEAFAKVRERVAESIREMKSLLPNRTTAE